MARIRSVAKTKCLRGVSSRGGRRSEMGSHSQRESEGMRGREIVRSGRGGLRQRAHKQNREQAVIFRCSWPRPGEGLYTGMLRTQAELKRKYERTNEPKLPPTGRAASSKMNSGVHEVRGAELNGL